MPKITPNFVADGTTKATPLDRAQVTYIARKDGQAMYAVTCGSQGAIVAPDRKIGGKWEIVYARDRLVGGFESVARALGRAVMDAILRGGE